MTACGGGGTNGTAPQPTNVDISGNWQVAITFPTSPNQAAFAGFLTESGSVVTGIVNFTATGCGGTANVTGTVSGQKTVLSVTPLNNAGGGTINGTASTDGTSMTGIFSSTQGGLCIPNGSNPLTANRVSNLSGMFHGTLNSTGGDTFTVSGAISQGPNAGTPIAPLSGTATVTNSACFSNVVVSGEISGTTAVINIASTDGTQTAGLTANTNVSATSLMGSYTVFTGACAGDSGTASISLP